MGRNGAFTALCARCQKPWGALDGPDDVGGGFLSLLGYGFISDDSHT